LVDSLECVKTNGPTNPKINSNLFNNLGHLEKKKNAGFRRGLSVGSTQGADFLDQKSKYHLRKKELAIA
jgi:hypothetical protein